MRFAHVSDLHLGMQGTVSPDHGHSAEEVALAISEDLRSISDVLDLVVVSGDLTDQAETASFAAFERTFSNIGLPVIVVPGNHDGPSAMHNYSAASQLFASWNITNRVIEVAGTRFLGLDTCVEDTTEGALDDEGLALLADEIASDVELRLVIVMHHPPLVLGLAQFDGFCELENRERLMEILGKARSPIVILSGHVHRPYTVTAGKLSCHVAGSAVAPYDSALPFGNGSIRPTTQQDFYFIHDLDPDGRHVVTVQRVRGLAQ